MKCKVILATNPLLQVKDYVEDPLNFVGKVRARTGNEILKVWLTFD